MFIGKVQKAANYVAWYSFYQTQSDFDDSLSLNNWSIFNLLAISKIVYDRNRDFGRNFGLNSDRNLGSVSAKRWPKFRHFGRNFFHTFALKNVVSFFHLELQSYKIDILKLLKMAILNGTFNIFHTFLFHERK